jgi:hypothetical protein
MPRKGEKSHAWNFLIGMMAVAATHTAAFSSSVQARGGYNRHPTKADCPATTELGQFFDRITNRCYANAGKTKEISGIPAADRVQQKTTRATHN